MYVVWLATPCPDFWWTVVRRDNDQVITFQRNRAITWTTSDLVTGNKIISWLRQSDRESGYRNSDSLWMGHGAVNARLRRLMPRGLQDNSTCFFFESADYLLKPKNPNVRLSLEDRRAIKEAELLNATSSVLVTRMGAVSGHGVHRDRGEQPEELVARKWDYEPAENILNPYFETAEILSI